jgi:hexosaminidase
MSRRSALILALALPLGAAAAEPAVVPNPASIVRHAGEFRLAPSTALVVEPGDGAAKRIAENLADLIHTSYGVRLRVREGPSTLRQAQGSGRTETGSTRTGVILLRHVKDEGAKPESYRIESRRERVVLTAASDAGLVHATATLWQLLTRDKNGATVPALDIEDAPRFGWRGLMLDSARHFQSPKFITHLIDWMALHKLNVLHWHLTDDQAWRLEIRKYPKLAQVGGWRVPAGAAANADIDSATGRPRLYGGYYSQDTVRSIVSYAADRGITIVPEIEMPGHASAAVAAYPQLAAGAHPPTAVPADWGIYDNVYNLEDSTFAFIEDVLTEVMAIFPGPYIHVGGDEVETTQWRESARVKVRMRELGIPDATRVQPYFTQRIGRFLSSRGRRLVGWDEILEPELSPNAVVMSWRGTEGALKAAANRHDTVLAAYPTLYFDNRQSASAEEPPGRGRVVSLQDVYAFEAMPKEISAENAPHVLGVQANVWTEHIRTEERVAWMTFPRLAAVAELGWSQPARRDWSDFRKRLTVLEARYPLVGLASAKAFPERTQNAMRRKSQELKLCSEDIALSLEDDAPLAGPRATFLVDVQNPCWIFPQAPLERARAIVAHVGQVPFNFQIGEAVKKIQFPKPTTPEGELEVRLDSCEGEVIARLPLAPAVANQAVTKLPPATIAPRPGRHDLCLRFAQPRLDPMWVIDAIRIEAAP